MINLKRRNLLREDKSIIDILQLSSRICFAGDVIRSFSAFTPDKSNYVHNNPVKAGIVENAEDDILSNDHYNCRLRFFISLLTAAYFKNPFSVVELGHRLVIRYGYSKA
ncbi:MAG: hypothetical protein JWQ09_921 [Segetibacter sp.]|nr:hypothetical protein [Segetibacter sp.]